MTPEQFVWVTPSRDEVPIPVEVLEALARLEKHMPGAKCLGYRKPGEKWRRP